MSEEVTVAIRFDQSMRVSDRADLVSRLECERGIAAAWVEGGDDGRLVVRYVRGWFSPVTLIDTIRKLGYSGTLDDG